MRDGKSFTTRRVTARQHGHPIFSMLVSFHADEPGQLEHQAKMPDVPMPEDLPSETEMRKNMLPTDAGPGAALLRARAADRTASGRIRALSRQDTIRTAASMSGSRATGTLPDDPAIHRCVLAYASDMGLLDTALVPHGRTVFEKDIHGGEPRPRACGCTGRSAPTNGCSYAQDSPNLHGARGFSRGLIFARDGTLVASVAQEGLVQAGARIAPSEIGQTTLSCRCSNRLRAAACRRSK